MILMSYQRVLLVILIIGISAILVYYLARMEQTETQQTASSRPIDLPYNWVGDIAKEHIAEPSGITYHPIRKSLFIADDSGIVYELNANGRKIQTNGVNSMFESGPSGCAQSAPFTLHHHS